MSAFELQRALMQVLRNDSGIRVHIASSCAPLEIGNITFAAALPRETATGLMGWLSFVLNAVLRVDGVAVRRTRAGRTTLSFPVRTAADGTRHPILRPLDAEARRRIEAAVLGALGRHLDE